MSRGLVAVVLAVAVAGVLPGASSGAPSKERNRGDVATPAAAAIKAYDVVPL